MRILIADQLPPSAVEILSSTPGWQVDARPSRSRSDVVRDIVECDAIIVRSATRVDRELIAAAPRLRVIARAGTGIDNVDLAAATDRGILVMNAPAANSVSVAELTLGLMVALSRSIPAADAAMKRGVWDKKNLTGAELRGKTLGIVGLGRVGQGVAARARSFEMAIVAHDPFIAMPVAAALGVELVSLDALCARADYITLHVPATAETRRLFDAARLASCRRGVRIVNTARGDLIDEAALADAIEAGHVAGAGLDVFETEPPPDRRLVDNPHVIATPHIAASTAEAQELVGIETAAAVRDFLRDGTIRNAVNVPAIPGDDLVRIRPFMRLGERMGAVVSHLTRGRTHAIGIRYYGALATGHTDLLASAVIAGVLQPMLSGTVTLVNAKAAAAARGIEIVESRSSRPRDFANLLSVKVQSTDGDHVIEGTVFEGGSPRLTLLDGVRVEAPLDGTLLVIVNDDRPGVIGEVGTVLGRHRINIASFALGRADSRAVGIVHVDAEDTNQAAYGQVVDELRAIPGVRDVRLITS
jgi:D-3-phosphoglycerate dehydrogenase / 2-oxoglutarate reductase